MDDLQISGRLGRSDKGLSRAPGIRLGRGARIWKAQEQARSAAPSVFGPLGSENASPGATPWCRRAASPNASGRATSCCHARGPSIWHGKAALLLLNGRAAAVGSAVVSRARKGGGARS